MSDMPDNNEFLRVKNTIVAKFDEENWLDIGMITDSLEIVRGHGRLLRSLNFGDPDYGGNAVNVLMQIVSRAPQNLTHIRDYVDERFPDSNGHISMSPGRRRITFCPTVFEVPDIPMDDTLVSVMMPFAPQFGPVYAAIKTACDDSGFSCRRADDIWEHSILIQDVFRLIFVSRVVVSDFTDRNPNVMYETGIAHTLGKTVVPITQQGKDIPFDLVHHRYLAYLPNSEGLTELTARLTQRLTALKS